MQKEYLKISSLSIFVILFIYLLYFIVLDISDSKDDSLKIKVLNEVKSSVYIGVVSRYPAHIIYQKYQAIIDRLNRESEYHYEIKLSRNYEETLKQLEDKIVVAAFLGSYIFSKYYQSKQLEAILKQVSLVENRSLLISKYDQNLNDIKVMALPSKNSFSSQWAFSLKEKKEFIHLEFKNYEYHQTVLNEVMNGNVDGGVVSATLYASVIKNNLFILKKSPLFPNAPLCMLANSYEKIKLDIRRILEKGDDFIPAKNKDYLIINELL